jgi:hypothetical protein
MKDFSTNLNSHIRGADGRRFGMATAIREAAHAAAACRYHYGFLAVHLGLGGPPITQQMPLFQEAMMRQREAGFRHAVVLLVGLLGAEQWNNPSLVSAVIGDVQAIVKYLALDAADEKALFQAAEAEARRFVHQRWGVFVELAEKLVECGTVEFDDAPESVLEIERVWGDIAPPPLRLPAEWMVTTDPFIDRVHECVRVFNETFKIRETGRRLGVCHKSVQRYLEVARHSGLVWYF